MRFLLLAVWLSSLSAFAGVETWRINEIVAGVEGNPNIRYIELYAPPSTDADNCLFPTTHIIVYDAAGTLVGSSSPVTTATCYAGGTYLILASTDAAFYFGIARDANLTATIPAEVGQVCFQSSATPYSCVRWGSVTMPKTDLTHPSDSTSAMGIAGDMALSRKSNTGVVASDFILSTPTPRGPNDGTAWLPPDAGPPADADLTPDAGIPDAKVYVDSPPRPSFDSRVDPAWLTASPGGGAMQCRVGGRGSAGALLLTLLLLAFVRRRR